MDFTNYEYIFLQNCPTASETSTARNNNPVSRNMVDCRKEIKFKKHVNKKENLIQDKLCPMYSFLSFFLNHL